MKRIKRNRNQPAQYEVLTVPFVGLGEAGLEGDDLADLGELQDGEFRGMASVFGMVIDAFTPTIMQRGAFTKTLKERSRAIPILWQHRMDEPIGSPVHLLENENGLVLQAKISRTARGRDALTLMRDGVVRALSIGFEAVVVEMQEQADKSFIRFIKEARLVEVSVVTLGADPNALITEVRSANGSKPAVAGTLRQWDAVQGIEVECFEEAPDEDHEEFDTDTQEGAVETFAEFVQAHPELSPQEAVEAFTATQTKAGPTPDGTESLTLSEVDDRLQKAELLAASMKLDQL